MANRALIVLTSQAKRAEAVRWIAAAPAYSRITFAGPKRTLPQNDMMWGLLTDISVQAEWAGKRRKPGEWKDIFTAALRSSRDSLEVVPGLNGGFVLLGMHTSDLSAEEMSDLIELILAWGAQNEITFTCPGRAAAA